MDRMETHLSNTFQARRARRAGLAAALALALGLLRPQPSRALPCLLHL